MLRRLGKRWARNGGHRTFRTDEQLRGRPRISVDLSRITGSAQTSRDSGDRVDVYRPRTPFVAVHGFAPQRRAGQSLAARRGLGPGKAATTTISLRPCGAGCVRRAHCQDIAASTPLPCADYLALTKAQVHSRRFFSQSSKYLCATARSVSLAWASALVYMSVIHVSSGLAASLATISQNSPSAA